jgi:hypothetical protein
MMRTDRTMVSNTMNAITAAMMSSAMAIENPFLLDAAGVQGLCG